MVDRTRCPASSRRRQAMRYAVAMNCDELCDVSEHTLGVSSLYVGEASEKGVLKQRTARLIRII